MCASLFQPRGCRTDRSWHSPSQYLLRLPTPRVQRYCTFLPLPVAISETGALVGKQQRWWVAQERDSLRRKLSIPGPRCHFFNSFFANKLFM